MRFQLTLKKVFKMKNKILPILILTTLFLSSCNETQNHENSKSTSKETTEKMADTIITISETDRNGNVLEMVFNNTVNTASLKLNGEGIDLVLDTTMASGTHYKNEHYQYTQWHGKTILEKDGKVIFEAGKEEIPK